MKISGQKVDTQTLMLAGIVDRLSWLVWSKTKDAQSGLNRPKSVLDSLYPQEKDVSVFASGEDFEQERNRIIAERSKQYGD